MKRSRQLAAEQKLLLAYVFYLATLEYARYNQVYGYLIIKLFLLNSYSPNCF